MRLNFPDLDFYEIKGKLEKDKYFRIKKSTTSQLTQLGLKRKKSLCKKYLNIFERFDIKKQQKIDEIILIIDGKE